MRVRETQKVSNMDARLYTFWARSMSYQEMDIPVEILREHVFPHLPIDTRRALGIPPRRLSILEKYETGPLGHAFRRRYNTWVGKYEACRGKGAQKLTVPLLTVDSKGDPRCWEPCYSPDTPWFYPVKLEIRYYTDLECFPDRIHIVVRKRDNRMPVHERGSSILQSEIHVTETGHSIELPIRTGGPLRMRKIFLPNRLPA